VAGQGRQGTGTVPEKVYCTSTRYWSRTVVTGSIPGQTVGLPGGKEKVATNSNGERQETTYDKGKVQRNEENKGHHNHTVPKVKNRGNWGAHPGKSPAAKPSTHSSRSKDWSDRLRRTISSQEIATEDATPGTTFPTKAHDKTLVLSGGIAEKKTSVNTHSSTTPT